MSSFNNNEQFKALKGGVLALTIASLIGCSTSSHKLSVSEQEHIFNQKVSAARHKHKNVEMKFAEISAIKAPTNRLKVKRDYLITVDAMRNGSLQGNIKFVKGVRRLISDEGIYKVPLNYQSIAYLSASANGLPDKKQLAVTEVRKQVDHYCGQFKYDSVSKSQDIKKVARFKFDQAVSSACFAFVSGEPVSKVNLYMGKAANEGVTIPIVWNELVVPMKDIESNEYLHGKTAVTWFEGKMRKHNINFND